jgi:hypothetical protein
VIRIERCACGGAIAVAMPASDEEIVRAVSAHNRTVRHLVWREKGDQAPDGYERRVA